MAGRAWTFFKEIAFLLLILLFFLKLGSDNLEQPISRMVYAGFLGFAFVLLPQKAERFKSLLQSPTAALFVAFLGFHVARLAWSAWQLAVKGVPDSVTLPLLQYLSSPVTWVFYFGFFAAARFLLPSRNETIRLFNALAVFAFLIAFATLPPLMIKGHITYAFPDGRQTFFPPFVYFHPLVSQYFIARYGHVNYVGDLVAIGFFPALGLFFYHLQKWKDDPSVPSLVRSGILLATQALAIFLLFSRATIICFALSFLLFLICMLIKFPSRIQFIFSGIALGLVLGFLVWAGNIQATWKEVKTVEGEFQNPARPHSSLAVNQEGFKRSLAMFRVFPLWGVGTGGYANVSEMFATPGVEHYGMTRYRAFCHYLQKVAEEGAGAFLYFLMLLVYFSETAVGLWKTKSRFQFMAGLSLCMPVLMILAHAAVKPLMDYFGTAVLVYILMGATLGVLSSDFEHA